MDPERWSRIAEVFHRVANSPEGERDEALRRECGDDDDLRREVESLLASDSRSERLLDGPSAVEAGVNDPTIGRTFGAYRVTARIAVGGMGVVYRAERVDGAFDREVALKLIRPDVATDEGVRRFELERRTLAALDHPNIARLHDAGRSEAGEPYLVMDLVDGVPIDRYCDSNGLSIEQRSRLFAAVCRAVDYAHRHLVVHRDLKPANVLVDTGGTPKLLDFGIARLVEEEGAEIEVTRTVGRVLTPEYASPEQLAGRPLTTSTDVYSLGVMLYGLLTGRRPFQVESQSMAAWERAVEQRPPTVPSHAIRGPEHDARREDVEPFAERCNSSSHRLAKQLAGDLDNIVLMALRKEPERRYASAKELADDLERHLDGRPVLARADSIAYRTRKFVVNHRLPVGAAVMVVAALTIGLLAALRSERRVAHEAEHARIEAVSFRSMSNFLLDTFLASGIIDGEDDRDFVAVRLSQQVERVRRQYEDVHTRANLIDELGNVFMTLDRFDEAEALIREALEMRREEFGERSLEVALSWSRLGNLAYRLGDPASAVDAFRRSLELHRELPVGTHTDVAGALNNLAAALRADARPEEAEALHVEALAIRRAQNERSLEVAESLNNLAGIHLGRGEFGESATLLRETLDIRLEVLGEQNSLTLQAMSNLGLSVYQAGDPEEGRALLESAASGYRELRAEGREGLSRVLSVLAGMDMLAADWDSAERHVSESIEIQRAQLGADHPALATTYARLGRILLGAGRIDDARDAWDEVVRLFDRAEVPKPELVRAMLKYAEFTLRTSGRAEAERVLDRIDDRLGRLDDVPLDLASDVDSARARMSGEGR